MKIKRFNTSEKEKIREAVGLPNDDIFPVESAFVSESPVCENTIDLSPVKRGGGLNDFSPSCGSTSPNTEVNADHQGVRSEVGGASEGIARSSRKGK